MPPALNGWKAWFQDRAKPAEWPVSASVVSALIVVFSGGGLGYVLSTAGGLLLGALGLGMSSRGAGAGYLPFELVTKERERYRRALRKTRLAMAALGILWLVFVVWVIDGAEWLTLVLAAGGALLVIVAGSLILKLLLHLDRRSRSKK